MLKEGGIKGSLRLSWTDFQALEAVLQEWVDEFEWEDGAPIKGVPVSAEDHRKRRLAFVTALIHGRDTRPD